MKYSAFCDLALGARFTYPQSKKVWVRIGYDTIAEWDEKFKDCKWIGQTIASFTDVDFEISSPVIVL